MAQATKSPAHTPGPWCFDPLNLIVYDSVVKLGIATVVTQAEKTDDSDETSANGWLITAAPDLLEALQTVNEWSKDSQGADFPYWVVEYAIRKAQGPQ